MYCQACYIPLDIRYKKLHTTGCISYITQIQYMDILGVKIAYIKYPVYLVSERKPGFFGVSPARLPVKVREDQNFAQVC